MIGSASLHDQIAAGQTLHHVAGSIKAVGGEGAGIGRRIVMIAADRVRPAGQQIAGLAIRDRIAGIIQDQHLIIGRDGATLGFGDNLLGIVQPRIVDQPFGHAEHLLQCAAQHGTDAPRCFRHELGAAHLQDLQAGQVMRFARRRLQPQERQRRHETGDGHAFSRDEGKGDVGRGLRRHHHARAGI